MIFISSTCFRYLSRYFFFLFLEPRCHAMPYRAAVRGLLVVTALSLVVATPAADAWATSPVGRRLHDKRARTGPARMAVDRAATAADDDDGGDYDEADEYDEDNGDYHKLPASTPAGDDNDFGKYLQGRHFLRVAFCGKIIFKL